LSSIVTAISPYVHFDGGRVDAFPDQTALHCAPSDAKLARRRRQ